MRRAGCTAAVIGLLVVAAAPAGAAAGSDPYCTGSYGGAAPRGGAPLRFGIDPGILEGRRATLRQSDYGTVAESAAVISMARPQWAE